VDGEPVTQINRDELSRLKTLDQAIVWAVLTLDRSNQDARNSWYNDNAAVRQEVAKDLVKWSITQDPATGEGVLAFTALSPLLDLEPMQTLQDVGQLIKSYSFFALMDQVVEEPVSDKGFPVAELPDWVESLEQALYYWVRIAEAVGRMIRYANLASQQPVPPTDPVTLDLSGPVPILLNLLTDLATEGSAEGTISQFEVGTPIYQGFTPWIQDIFDNLIPTGASSGITSVDQIAPGDGYQPKGIETLPVCKEQDPSVVAFNANSLAELLSKKT
jgi:hypothetical protein